MCFVSGVMETRSLQHVGKGQLLRDFSALVGKDRGNSANMLAYIAEIDRRKLYLEHAYPSMFAFCTGRFRMSEAIAAKRIRAGRTAYRFPCILGMVRRGELHLSGVHQLAGHLTEGNHEEVLRRARYRSMREIEKLIAEIAPKPDARSMIRALPTQRADLPGGTTQQRTTDKPLNNEALTETSHARGSAFRDGNVGTPARKPRNPTTPLSPRRYKLQVTIGQEARDKLTELQDLLSHQIPDGDPAAVIERALEALLADTKKKRAALTNKPRPRRKKATKRTRTIPAHVRRAVFERDGGRCAFVDGEGQRCGSGWQVEFHHCVPYARGGLHDAENLELRCRAHNRYEAEREYGRLFMSSAVATSRSGG